jgi:hypothetical protein
MQVNRRFKGTFHLHLLATCLILVSWLAYTSALNMVATCSSETSVDFGRTTRRNIPGDRTLHGHRCENFKSYGLNGVLKEVMCQLHNEAEQFSQYFS